MKKLKLSTRDYGRLRVMSAPKAPKNFFDLLESGRELDCNLMVGNVDMPATFVWNEDSKISEYGIEKYRTLMDAPIRFLHNGTLELLCDDWKMGEEFCIAAAGYIGESEYQKIFG